MTLKNPESFYVFVLVLGFILLLTSIFFPTSRILLISSIVICQGIFQLINSQFGIHHSIQKSLFFALSVYVLFVTYLLLGNSANKIGATFWCLGWAAANIIPAVSIMYKCESFKQFTFADTISFFRQRDILKHSLGHLSAITVAWYAFLYSRTFYDGYDNIDYSAFLQTGIFISLLIGAIEVLFNTVFLTKVLRAPNNLLEFRKYLNNFCFLLFTSNLFFLLLYKPLTHYYFPSDFVYIAYVYAVLLATENMKLYFNLAINNAARCFDYRLILKLSLPLVLMLSCLSFLGNISHAFWLIFCAGTLIITIGFYEKFLSIQAAILLFLCNFNTIFIFYFHETTPYFTFATVYFVLILIFAYYCWYIFKISDAIRDFLNYD